MFNDRKNCHLVPQKKGWKIMKVRLALVNVPSCITIALLHSFSCLIFVLFGELASLAQIISCAKVLLHSSPGF